MRFPSLFTSSFFLATSSMSSPLFLVLYFSFLSLFSFFLPVSSSFALFCLALSLSSSFFRSLYLPILFPIRFFFASSELFLYFVFPYRPVGFLSALHHSVLPSLLLILSPVPFPIYTFSPRYICFLLCIFTFIPFSVRSSRSSSTTLRHSPALSISFLTFPVASLPIFSSPSLPPAPLSSPQLP